MSEEVDKMNEVLGKTAPTHGAEAIDWKAKAEELEHKVEADGAWRGRLKKANDENEALRRRIAELESKHRQEDLLSGLSEDERSSIPDEVISLNQKVAEKVEERLDKRLRAIEEREQAQSVAAQESARKNITQRVREKYPKFLSDVSDGGDKFKAWKDYKRYNEASVTGAFESGDFETLCYHIENFYRSNGIQVPSVKGESAAPEPHSTGGGVPIAVAPGRIYTTEEFSKLFDLKEEARDRGDWAEVKRIGDEINRAPAEGRVKD